MGKLFHGERLVPKTAFDEYGGKRGSAAPFTSSDLQNSKQNPFHIVNKLGKTLNFHLMVSPQIAIGIKPIPLIGVRLICQTVFFLIGKV